MKCQSMRLVSILAQLTITADYCIGVPRPFRLKQQNVKLGNAHGTSTNKGQRHRKGLQSASGKCLLASF